MPKCPECKAEISPSKAHMHVDIDTNEVGRYYPNKDYIAPVKTEPSSYAAYYARHKNRGT